MIKFLFIAMNVNKLLVYERLLDNSDIDNNYSICKIIIIDWVEKEQR